MSYAIQFKNDILTGATLVIRIPEKDVDQKALLTVGADMPSFILPFRYSHIEGEVELIYQIGLKCKLQHMEGRRSTEEYAQLWASLLEPLFVCGDWFMKPRAFILSIEYLFYDKEKNTASYVYIPTTQDVSDHCALRELTADVSKIVTVDNPVLENKVLRAIMKNFEPEELLKLLRLNKLEDVPASAKFSERNLLTAAKLPEEGEEESCLSIAPAQIQAMQLSPQQVLEFSEDAKPEPELHYDPRDIIIEIPEKTSRTGKSGEKAAASKAVRSREKKNQKGGTSVGGFFSKIGVVEPVVSELPQGAGRYVNPAEQYAEADIASMSWDGIGADTQSSSHPAFRNYYGKSPATESVSKIRSFARLRNDGSQQLPMAIDVSIAPGELFSIGRHDSSSGRKQSSFEFEKKTKAVSRRHAVIERDGKGYKITDLASSAGTFINESRLPPNTAFALESGFRISFGNCGADYIWECKG
ncbi:MAG: FHA domain-containing protein [Oscillospiraceae bacterium]|nr:FHA domain-containing protein [Oscillospiraceae bacterium]